MLKLSVGSEGVIRIDVETGQPGQHVDGVGSVAAAAHHVRKEVDKAVQAFPDVNLEHVYFVKSQRWKTGVLFGRQLGEK